MKRIFVAAELDPRELIKNWEWTPRIRNAGWPAKDSNGKFYDLKYLDVNWLGFQISLNNERD